MRVRLTIVFVVLASILIAVAVLGYAHVHNAGIEQQRRASLTALDDGESTANLEHGEAVARAAGCIACHTDTRNDGQLLAGGVELSSPFGTFVSPNISSDRVYGIGSWTVDMLAEALLNGRRPDGNHYWPAFPYPAFTAMNEQDIIDLHAWLQSTDPVGKAAPEHELVIPDMARSALSVWKALYVPDDYQPGRFAERGEYLVESLAHCAACHAPRNLIGGVPDRRLSGNLRGPDGARVPAITAEALQEWTEEDLTFFLEIGMTPEGDFSGGHMAIVIEQGTAHLSPADRRAMAEYLKSATNTGAP